MTLSPEQLKERMALIASADATIREIDALTQREAEALTASTGPRGSTGGMVSRMAAVSGPAHPSPSGERPSASPIAITAACSGAGIAAGTPLADSEQLALLMSDKLRQISAGRGERDAIVASALWAYPEDRQLGLDDVTGNSAKLDAVCGLDAGRYDASGALVATGGICLPVNVDYAVPTWSGADRPLRDGLPAYQATRGGVRFVTPPDIGVPSLQGTASGAGTSVSIWTEATDANPAGATKPVWVVACGAEQLVYVNAVPTRVQFGNMESRFAPEQVAANTQQAIASSAREAELELLTLIANNSKQILPQAYLGAARDLLSSLDWAMSSYRYSHRIPKNAAFTAIFPDWARDVIRADLAREVAHDNAGSINVLAITDDQIDDLFKVRGVNVIWTLDGLRAGTYGTGGSAIPNQFFPIATAGQEPKWPGGQTTTTTSSTFTLAWFLYVEGTFQFLDGGRLDLGVVRDSLLDATNDYETFVEVFETIAFRGLECYQVQSLISATGGSAGTVATSGYVE
jgi:hypothetical protein